MSGETVSGGCHCGAVRFEAVLAGGREKAIRCNCSACRMRGAVLLLSDRITQGAERLTPYRFNTGAAEHFFCATCGIYTYHQRRFDPTQFAINVACIDGMSPFDFAAVPVVDGQRHPLDHAAGRSEGSERCGSRRPTDRGSKNTPGETGRLRDREWPQLKRTATLRRERIVWPIKPKPISIIAQVAGSGTALGSPST